MKKEKQTVIRVNSKEMTVKEFRQKYVTLGKDKAKHEKDLEAYANKFLEKNYNTSLTVPIKISGRLTSTGGYFKARIEKGIRKPMEIQMSERFIASALHDGQEGLEAILDTLKHELVHYVLFKLGKEFRDGDCEFESELARLDIGTSGTTNKELVKSKKLNVWYSIVDIYEQQGYDMLKEKVVTYKTYKNHAQKQAKGNRIAYEVVKSYF